VAGRSAIGLDIGTSGVRAAELSFGKGGVTLEKFGQVALPEGAVRDGDFKLVDNYEGGGVELFNLKNDPGETQNLAATEPARAEDLRRELYKWRAEVGAHMPTPNPEFDAATRMFGMKLHTYTAVGYEPGGLPLNGPLKIFGQSPAVGGEHPGRCSAAVQLSPSSSL